MPLPTKPGPRKPLPGKGGWLGVGQRQSLGTAGASITASTNAPSEANSSGQSFRHSFKASGEKLGATASSNNSAESDRKSLTRQTSCSKDTCWTLDERKHYLAALHIVAMGEEPIMNFLCDAIGAAPLPAPWTMRRDPKGRLFFANQPLEVVSWHHPLEPSLKELAGAFRVCLTLHSPSLRRTCIEGLRNTWEQEAKNQFSKWYSVKHESGKPYYCHRETGEAMWEHPAEVVLPAHFLKLKAMEWLLDDDYWSSLTKGYVPVGNIGDSENVADFPSKWEMRLALQNGALALQDGSSRPSNEDQAADLKKVAHALNPKLQSSSNSNMDASPSSSKTLGGERDLRLSTGSAEEDLGQVRRDLERQLQMAVDAQKQLHEELSSAENELKAAKASGHLSRLRAEQVESELAQEKSSKCIDALQAQKELAETKEAMHALQQRLAVTQAEATAASGEAQRQAELRALSESQLEKVRKEEQEEVELAQAVLQEERRMLEAQRKRLAAKEEAAARAVARAKAEAKTARLEADMQKTADDKAAAQLREMAAKAEKELEEERRFLKEEHERLQQHTEAGEGLVAKLAAVEQVLKERESALAEQFGEAAELQAALKHERADRSELSSANKKLADRQQQLEEQLERAQAATASLEGKLTALSPANRASGDDAMGEASVQGSERLRCRRNEKEADEPEPEYRVRSAEGRSREAASGLPSPTAEEQATKAKLVLRAQQAEGEVLEERRRVQEASAARDQAAAGHDHALASLREAEIAKAELQARLGAMERMLREREGEAGQEAAAAEQKHGPPEEAGAPAGGPPPKEAESGPPELQGAEPAEDTAYRESGTGEQQSGVLEEQIAEVEEALRAKVLARSAEDEIAWAEQRLAEERGRRERALEECQSLSQQTQSALHSAQQATGACSAIEQRLTAAEQLLKERQEAASRSSDSVRSALEEQLTAERKQVEVLETKHAGLNARNRGLEEQLQQVASTRAELLAELRRRQEELLAYESTPVRRTSYSSSSTALEERHRLALDMATRCESAPSSCRGSRQNTSRRHGHAEVRVTSSLTLKNLDYHKLSANPALFSSFKEGVRKTLVSLAGNGVTPEGVELALSAGSVVISATITPPRGVPPAAVQDALKTCELGTSVTSMVGSMEGIHEAATGPISAADVHVSTQVQRPADSRGSREKEARRARKALEDAIVLASRIQLLRVEGARTRKRIQKAVAATRALPTDPEARLHDRCPATGRPSLLPAPPDPAGAQAASELLQTLGCEVSDSASTVADSSCDLQEFSYAMVVRAKLAKAKEDMLTLNTALRNEVLQLQADLRILEVPAATDAAP